VGTLRRITKDYVPENYGVKRPIDRLRHTFAKQPKEKGMCGEPPGSARRAHQMAKRKRREGTFLTERG